MQNLISENMISYWKPESLAGNFGRYKMGVTCYILGDRAIERQDFHRYNLGAAVILGGRNSERQIRHMLV